MAEGGVSTCPQVFVVDSQAGYVSVPVSRRKPRWARVGQKSLLLLVGLALLGLVVEGCFIYSLYKKTQEFSPCKSHPLCQDLSGRQVSVGVQYLLVRHCVSHCHTARCLLEFSAQMPFFLFQGDTMSQMRTKESNEIPTVRPHLDQLQQRPFAQLIGSNTPKGENNVVLWLNTAGETVTNNMVYENGRLIVEKDGYYYLYSKVTLNSSEECVLIQHKVMKGTKAYGNKIELMKSKSIRCGTRTTKSSSAKASDREDRWNSFLAGIFHLRSGDTIFVELENIDKIHPGNTENLMGAFMIFPGDMLK
ncbi:tumor necrosis factor ligand superfamily member 10-like isoform X1 [Sebastes umbrosus]|uniref:tumor necrosis factor ligand superfamily member 10-like isoform X1 n=1 Tax=Sebastes umbrosus TaxID=72105 RepID=UPI00189CF578|nr:tumor necrosis factor ligand superfamily member 10-like isoform X1 [Sebastes umbrosus]XP_037617983.1 tumor necrosis factor ligand superfamily member 10-like isoform X1 [Sebastes umbrosus]XP_037617992.1 tumor necrosis factor ligand superfamily member 10-like isoform X1 [Sebastes umbrosus]XP_037617998.1 tumor necrosis factor ligand superfamily member 10-like isoform X1 [Sebastes umbrosus]